MQQPQKFLSVYIQANDSILVSVMILRQMKS